MLYFHLKVSLFLIKHVVLRFKELSVKTARFLALYALLTDKWFATFERIKFPASSESSSLTNLWKQRQGLNSKKIIKLELKFKFNFVITIYVI